MCFGPARYSPDVGRPAYPVNTNAGIERMPIVSTHTAHAAIVPAGLRGLPSLSRFASAMTIEMTSSTAMKQSTGMKRHFRPAGTSSAITTTASWMQRTARRLSAEPMLRALLRMPISRARFQVRPVQQIPSIPCLTPVLSRFRRHCIAPALTGCA